MGQCSSNQLYTNLYEAIKNGNVTVAKNIIQSIKYEKLSLDVPIGEKGQTPLVLAILEATNEKEISKEKTEIAKLLIKAGCNVNLPIKFIINMTPLYAAVRKNHVQLVKLLIAAGANVNQPISQNDYPLNFACAMGYFEMVQLLLEANANPNSPCLGPGGSPLFISVHAGSKHSISIAKLLVKYGCDPLKVNLCGNTALHNAAHVSGDNKGCLDFLLSKGIDINHKNHSGMTPLMLAVQYKKLSTVKYLIEKGASVDTKDATGQTILEIAISTENKEIIALIETSID